MNFFLQVQCIFFQSIINEIYTIIKDFLMYLISWTTDCTTYGNTCSIKTFVKYTDYFRKLINNSITYRVQSYRLHFKEYSMLRKHGTHISPVKPWYNTMHITNFSYWWKWFKKDEEKRKSLLNLFSTKSLKDINFFNSCFCENSCKMT